MLSTHSELLETVRLDDATFLQLWCVFNNPICFYWSVIGETPQATGRVVEHVGLEL